ncbi:hypothetical protein ACIRU8_31385 [Streptomyces sp. NPDC101175]|uniref:hypothetical protein n=1 Tax=Streptomyces sp. NPDC101175 TaxID=3366123 RepID=UPI00383700CF
METQGAIGAENVLGDNDVRTAAVREGVRTLAGIGLGVTAFVVRRRKAAPVAPSPWSVRQG